MEEIADWRQPRLALGEGGAFWELIEAPGPASDPDFPRLIVLFPRHISSGHGMFAFCDGHFEIRLVPPEPWETSRRRVSRRHRRQQLYILRRAGHCAGIQNIYLHSNHDCGWRFNV